MLPYCRLLTNASDHPSDRATEGRNFNHGYRSNDSSFGWLDGMQTPAKAAPRVATQTLPFTVRTVTSEADLSRVQALRAEAYGHHLPALAASFGAADPIDRMPDTTIFFAEDKATGEVVGSVRIQSNHSSPLQIERSIDMPPEREGQLLSEITRLAVRPGYAPPVRLALVKASQLFCQAMQINGVLAGSRRSLLRQYFSLGFSDLYADERMVPLKHAGGLDHRVLFLDTVTCEADARERGLALHGFVFRTYHPDIMIFGSVAATIAHGLGGAQPQRIWARAA